MTYPDSPSAHFEPGENPPNATIQPSSISPTSQPSATPSRGGVAELSEAETKSATRPSVALAVRRIGAALIAVTAILIAVWGAPRIEESSTPGTPSYASIENVLARQAANEVTAHSAPQQQVVNGWATVDMLEVVAKEIVDLSAELDETLTRTQLVDHRPVWLITLGVIGLALGLATSPGVVPSTNRR